MILSYQSIIPSENITGQQFYLVDECQVSSVFLYTVMFLTSPHFSDIQNIAVKVLNFNQIGVIIEKCHSKGTEGIANTGIDLSLHYLLRRICPKTLDKNGTSPNVERKNLLLAYAKNKGVDQLCGNPGHGSNNGT